MFKWIFLLFLSGCTITEVKDNAGVSSPVQAVEKYQTSISKLSWETNHPERSEWSGFLNKYINEKFSSLDKAQDFSRYCPKYKLLTKDQKVLAWSEFFVALSYYESAWNPNDASVDVGIEGDRDTYSIGLLQMSVIDQESYHLPLGYKYNDLIKPEPGLRLGIYIMAQQIEKQGLVCVSKNVYWATLSCKLIARYEVNDEIANRLQKNVGVCK